MPNGLLTLLDIAQRSGNDAIVGIIGEVVTSAPEFSVVPAQTRPGTSYKVSRRTALPPFAFRDANSGVNPGKSAWVQDLKPMYFIDAQLEVDEAIVKGDPGEAGNLLADEASGALESITIGLGTQFYYGQDAQAKGFAGLQTQIADNGEVNANGGANSTSAYLVDLSRQGVNFVVGNQGEIALPPWHKQQITKPDGTKLMAFVSNISSYIGLQVGSEFSVYRVKGIKATATVNYLTDATAAALVAKIPIKRRGNLRWFMNRTALLTLQLSRSAIGQVGGGNNGAPAFAETPTTLAGYPITLTDSLVDTENNA